MVTTVEQIKKMAIKEVTIKGFEEGQVIVLRLKAISMMSLMKAGKLPNSLLGTAVDLFKKNTGVETEEKEDEKDENEQINQLSEMIDIMCEMSMVQPTFEEVKDYLNDDQKLEIFSYTQGGIDHLDSFRKDGENSKLD